jgi:hypothetical protein
VKHMGNKFSKVFVQVSVSFYSYFGEQWYETCNMSDPGQLGDF